MFCEKYSQKIRYPIILYTKEYHKEGTMEYLPMYLLPFWLENM